MSTHEQAEELKRRILELHKQGYLGYQIAQQLGVSAPHVAKRLREMGIHTKKRVVDTYVRPKNICDTCKYEDCVWNGESARCPMETGKDPKGYKKRLERLKK